MIEIKNIVENDLCVGCGMCISQSDSTMVMNQYGFLVPELNGTFTPQAIKLCPFNPSPDIEVSDEDKLAKIFLTETKRSDNQAGNYINTYVGFSKPHRKTSSSGGIATYVFEQLLKENIVQNLFIVKELNGNYAYQWFNDINQIKHISKTRYIPVTLENLFKKIDSKEGRVAVSGVACFIKAIRLKQYYNPTYKDKIPFLVGIICGGLKSKFFTDYLAQKAGVETQYSKQEYRIKDPTSSANDYSFGAYDISNSFHKLKMKSVGDMWGSGLFKAKACDFCDDVTTELADISLGDAWLDPYKQDGLGNSVIVTRSSMADDIIMKGINNRMLNVENLSFDKFKSSQRSSFKHRQKAIFYRLKHLSRTGNIIPQKRARLFQNIPIEFKIVQKNRMITRMSSLVIWKKHRSAIIFDEEIKTVRNNLNYSTLWYHRVQKLKRKIGFKQL